MAQATNDPSWVHGIACLNSGNRNTIQAYVPAILDLYEPYATRRLEIAEEMDGESDHRGLLARPSCKRRTRPATAQVQARSDAVQREQRIRSACGVGAGIFGIIAGIADRNVGEGLAIAGARSRHLHPLTRSRPADHASPQVHASGFLLAA